MAHPLFGPEVRMMLLDKSAPAMKAFVETLNPMTVAEALSGESFTVEQVWEVLEKADPHEQAKVFEFFPMEWQVKLAEGAGRPQMARLIELMSHDDRVDLLRRLPRQVSEALLRLVDEADRRDIANLSRYAENTVGSIMTTDYAWLPPGLTAQQAIERLRAQAPNRETIYYVYIVDEQTRKMLGILTLRALVLADPNTPIRKLMLTNDVVHLRAADDQETAAQALEKYGLIAIPVLDAEDRLVGIVTHDDIVEVIRELALGHIVVRDWFKVLRHEVVMGLLLGLTLGVIGLFRGASTSEDLRSAKKEMEAPIQVVVPTTQDLTKDAKGAFQVPEGTAI